MPITQQTTMQTEADLEAKISETVGRVFPWLGPGSVHHQTKFSFTFGRTSVEVDGLSVSRHEARADILLNHGERALAVLELKRPGHSLTPADVAQGLSYARMLHPRAEPVLRQPPIAHQAAVSDVAGCFETAQACVEAERWARGWVMCSCCPISADLGG